jgi:AcrR family transcriptional regulator
MNEPGRVYGGRSEAERRADRRGRLLAAGLELFGTEGWAGASIERLCAEAGVATRSFYEEFASRDLLLLAVYEDVFRGVIEAVLPTVTAGPPEERIRRGLTGYVEHLTADPRRARVVHREIRLAGTLERQRQRMLVRFADLIATQARLPRDDRSRILGLALAGAVSEVLVDWVAHPEPRPSTQPMVDVVVDLYVKALVPA